MASLIDIRRRIRSVKNTQKITKAMKMVAAARLRRAQNRVVAARPFAKTLEATLSSVVSKLPPREDDAPLHPLLATRPEKRVVVVIVSGDRGLCGAFNSNINRAAGLFLKKLKASAESVRLVVLGKKAVEFWKRRPYEILEARPGVFQNLSYESAAEIARKLAQLFISGEADAVYVLFNEFKSVIAQVVRTRRLLPLEIEETKENTVDYLFEPGPDEILSRLLPRHLEFQLYRVLLESNAAENAARMTAMDGASKNAGEMIDALTLTYNRARQARITKELIEIVSGAAALG